MRKLLIRTLCLSLLAGACSSEKTSEPTTKGGIEIDPVAAIEAFDPSPRTRSRSFAGLETVVIVDPEATRAAALGKLDAEDPDVRLAAVYALGRTMTQGDASRLAPFLASADAAQRLLAASAMISVGDPRAVPHLIAALGSDEVLPLAEPIRAWEEARFALLTFTGQDLGLRKAADVKAAAATKAAWEAWWAQAGRSFKVVRAPHRFSP